jgi:hypothetical protein
LPTFRQSPPEIWPTRELICKQWYLLFLQDDDGRVDQTDERWTVYTLEQTNLPFQALFIGWSEKLDRHVLPIELASKNRPLPTLPERRIDGVSDR